MQLKKIRITGFRGFNGTQEFDLSSPVIILFGENGAGKSSFLNAIEWCLFGEEIVGKATGIRERVNWEIKNRHSKECIVELHITQNDKKYIVKRILKGKSKHILSIESPDGDTLSGDEAYEKLSELLHNITFKDFMSSVYQHQEVIRFILTQEPRDRNEAIDRLLGLSQYRNFIEGIDLKSIKPEKLQEEITSLEREIEAKVKVWEEQIESYEKELKEKNICEPEICEKGIKRMCDEIKDKLSKFTRELGINLSEEFKSVTLDNVNEFLELGKKEIIRLRSEMPDIKRQKELHEKMLVIEKNKSNFEKLKNDYEDKQQNLKNFIEKNGNIEKLEEKLKEVDQNIKFKKQERKNTNQHGNIIKEALDYLNSEGVPDKNKCPVCGSKTDNLIEHLDKEYREKFERELKKIDEEIEDLQRKKNKIENLIRDGEKLQKDFEEVKEEFSNLQTKLRKDLGLTERDDVLHCIELKKKKIEEEINKITQNIKEKQGHLTQIECQFPIIEKFLHVIELREKREKAREITKTENWRKLEEKAEGLKRLREALENIVESVKKTSLEDAQNKIDLIKQKVSKNFKNLTQHPLISHLQIEVKEDRRTGSNSYNFQHDGKDVTPILSQGQLNSLALSIFLSMTETTDFPFSFIMLDDPSQSLGKEEKEKLADILNNISQNRDLILSTMDGELFQFLNEKITKEKITYVFEDWTPEEGPIVSREKNGY